MKKALKVIAICTVLLVGGTVILPTQIGSLNSYAASKPKISKKKATIIKGKSIRLKVKNTNGKKVKWSSSKNKIATVKKGTVTAKKAGKATIIAKVGKKKLRCRVTVKNPTTRLNKTKVTLTLGQKYKLTAKSNGKSKSVKWKSSNSSVASVYKGTVTAKMGGTAKITATMNGASKSCTITVLPYRKYNEGRYRVGVNIPAGEYYVFATKEYGGSLEITSKSSGGFDSLVGIDFFNYNSIVNIKPEQFVIFDDCYAIPAAYAKLSTSGDGMFKVGRDIYAGKHQIMAIGSNGGYYEITKDSTHSHKDFISCDYFYGNGYVTVENGQYIRLVNAKIVK